MEDYSFRLQFSEEFLKRYKKISNKNLVVKNKVKKALQLLSTSPHSPSLRSHKVNTRTSGANWSSRVSGDIRIIWNFDKIDVEMINLYNIGGHTGKHKVYK